MIRNILPYTLILGMLSGACARKPGPEPVPAGTPASTFAQIQRRILTPTCATAGCHASTQDPGYASHQLVLTTGESYKNLFNVKPVNTLAVADGLLRVKPYKSLESLFYHKLNFDASHHGGKFYGSSMPLGGSPLSVGQIDFVRRWIEAGAPETGIVADSTLLDDKTPSPGG